MLITFKEAHKNSLYQLEQKKLELIAAQKEIQTLKIEQTSTVSKVRFVRDPRENHFFKFYLVRKIRRN